MYEPIAAIGKWCSTGHAQFSSTCTFVNQTVHSMQTLLVDYLNKLFLPQGRVLFPISSQIFNDLNVNFMII